MRIIVEREINAADCGSWTDDEIVSYFREDPNELFDGAVITIERDGS